MVRRCAQQIFRGPLPSRRVWSRSGRRPVLDCMLERALRGASFRRRRRRSKRTRNQKWRNLQVPSGQLSTSGTLISPWIRTMTRKHTRRRVLRRPLEARLTNHQIGGLRPRRPLRCPILAISSPGRVPRRLQLPRARRPDRRHSSVGKRLPVLCPAPRSMRRQKNVSSAEQMMRKRCFCPRQNDSSAIRIARTC